ncbi:MAG: hypothetical protein J6B91_06115 [Prevotella sp.]|nr:hypothetical protein [Prevotella sp.]
MKHLITIWAVMLSVASASAQKVVEWNELLTVIDENKRTVYYDRDSHKPLKGSYHIKRGLDVEAVKLKDGVVDGEYRRYRYDELREAGRYVKGKRDGLFTEYHVGGKVVQKETPMNNGNIDGTVRIYFSNGKIDTEKEYRMSVENGVERRYDNTTGEQVFETHYADGKKEGEEWETADNGNGTRSRVVRHYKNGQLHGPYRNELTHYDGTPFYLIEGEYTSGKKSGRWVERNYDTNTETCTWHGEGGA